MATIIDELIVRLGIDSRGLVDKSSDAKKKLDELDEGAQNVEKSSKGAAAGMSEAASKLTRLLAVVGGTVAIRSFVKDVVDSNTQLGFLARNLGMATQALFAWGGAIAEIGGNKAAIQNFARTIAEMPGQLLTGQMPQLLPLFARLGISFREPFDQVMLDLSKRFAAMPRTMAYSFGLANGIPEDVMNLLLQGPGAVSLALNRTGKFGPTPEEVATAKAMKQQLADIEMQFEKIGYDILQKASPYLEKFFAVIQKFGAWLQEHETFTTVLTVAAAGLAGVASGATVLSAAAMALGASLPALGAAFAALADPVTLLVAALGAGTAAVVAMYPSVLQGTIGGLNSGSQRLGGRIGDTERLLFGIETQEGFFKAGSAPQRANNPGSILWNGSEGFAAKHGATGGMPVADGKEIAIFPDVQTGQAAALALIRSSEYKNLTVAELINRWTTGGKGPTPPGYLAGVLKASGLAPNVVPSEVAAPIALSTATTASAAPQDGVWSSLWNGFKHVLWPDMSTQGTKTINNSIGTIHVHTQATDAKGIAADIKRAMDWQLAGQFNTGAQ